MLQLGFNDGDAFVKERDSGSKTKYIFETVSHGFAVPIPKGIRRSEAALDAIKDRLISMENHNSRNIAIFEKQLQESYGVELKFIKVNDIFLRNGKWYYTYLFRTVKPMTVKEFYDIFEKEDLLFVHIPCNIIEIIE